MLKYVAIAALLCFGCEQEKVQTRPPLELQETQDPKPEVVTTPTTDEPTGKCTFKPQTVHLEAVPTALLVMMDRSNSMKVLTTGNGSTRWQVVSSAMQSFLKDERSQTLRVGLSFFPVELKGDPPKSCAKDADCGLYGPCYSFSGGGICLVAAGMKPYASCDFNDYVAPVILPAKVADQPTKVINTFSTEEQWGNTPTGPALAGALAYLEAYAAANPNTKTALLFATDGEPTECAPQDKNGLAAIAKAGFDKGLRTFVIGLGVGSAVMNSIALAGSGDKQLAFLIEAKAADAADQFLEALKDVRAAARSCEFNIKSEGELDVSKLSLSIEMNGSKDAVPYVQVETACDASKPGWYYAAAKDGSPLAVLCPSSCAVLQQGEESILTIGDVCLSE